MSAAEELNNLLAEIKTKVQSEPIEMDLQHLLVKCRWNHIPLEEIGTSEEELRGLFRECKRVIARKMLTRTRKDFVGVRGIYTLESLRHDLKELMGFIRYHNLSLTDIGTDEAEIGRLAHWNIWNLIRQRVYVLFNPRARQVMQFHQYGRSLIKGTTRVEWSPDLGQKISRMIDQQFIEEMTEDQFFHIFYRESESI